MGNETVISTENILAATKGDPPAYDYNTAKEHGPPLNHAENFFNLYTHELSKSPLTRDEATQRLYQIWGKGGDLDAYPWPAVIDKINKYWPTPVPEEISPSSTTRKERLTDLGNAKRFVRALHEQARYVHGQGWLTWTGTYWQPDTKRGILFQAQRVIADLRDEAKTTTDPHHRDRVERWALRSEAATRIEAMIYLASSEPEIALSPHDLDNDPNLLCCPNGTLDITNGHLHPHQPESLISRQTNAPYHPDAKSLLLDQFEQTFMGGREEREYIWRILGSTLLGGNPHRNFIVIYGTTTSGKSMLLDGITATLGRGYVARVNSSVYRGTPTEKARPDLLRALNARIIVADETTNNTEFHADQLKRLTGGDPLTARGIYSNIMIERAPDFTPILVTNAMPRIKDADDAVARRIAILAFNKTVPPNKVDITIKPKFANDPATQQALLAKLIHGAQRSITRPTTDRPKIVTQAVQKALNELDDLEEFILSAREENQLLEYQPHEIPASHCVTVTQLHRAYIHWRREHGLPERGHLAPSTFRKRLEHMGWTITKSNTHRWAGKILKTP